MSNQLPTIICVIFGIISWYYFNKFLESEREYTKLHKRFDNLHIENQKMRSRIKDLQSYKTDVSKTFQILDNELVMINDHLKRRNNTNNLNNPISQQPLHSQQTENRNQPPQQNNIRTTIHTSTIPFTRLPLSRISSFANLSGSGNVSLLTPELLTSLFNMNSEDIRLNIPNNRNDVGNGGVDNVNGGNVNSVNGGISNGNDISNENVGNNIGDENNDNIGGENVGNNIDDIGDENVGNNIGNENVSNVGIVNEDNGNNGNMFARFTLGDNSGYDQYLLNN